MHCEDEVGRLLKTGNLLAPVLHKPEESVEVLAAGPAPDEARVERIVSCGHVSPDNFWYDQDQQEWVAVIQGEAELEFEDRTLRLRSGDWVLIPAHARHRVTYTSTAPPCVWVAVFLPAPSPQWENGKEP